VKHKEIVMAVKHNRTTFSMLAAAVFVAGFLYFAYLPQIQADNYISTVKPVQAALDTQVDKLKGLLELDTFTKPNQPSKVLRADVESVAKVIDGIKKELSANEGKFTNLQEYPLLFLHPHYSSALSLKNLEGSYIQDIKIAVSDFEAVAAYFTDSADIAANVESGSLAVSATSKLKTIKQMIIAFEIASESMRKGAIEYEKLNPPALLKPYHDITVQYNEGRTKLFEQFVVALKKEDEKKISTLSSQITTLTDNGNSQAEIVLKDFVSESTLRKTIDRADKTSQDIAKILAKS
jgi:hypothetical protein